MAVFGAGLLKWGNGLGSHFLDFVDLRCPGKRKVDSSPNRFAVVCCQAVFPNGIPPHALCRRDFNSDSVSR